MHANVQIYAHPSITAMPINRLQFDEKLPKDCAYSTTAATAAKAPAAPIPITGPICTAAPLAFVEALVVLPVCVCVPAFEVEDGVEDVEPPFAAPVVDAVVDVGVDAA